MGACLEKTLSSLSIKVTASHHKGTLLLCFSFLNELNLAVVKLILEQTTILNWGYVI